MCPQAHHVGSLTSHRDTADERPPTWPGPVCPKAPTFPGGRVATSMLVGSGQNSTCRGEQSLAPAQPHYCTAG